MKLFKRILALTLGFGMTISSVACSSAKPTPNYSSTNTVWTPQTVYAKAQELGFDGTWEEFRELMKGVDGVGIDSVSVNSNGELMIRLSNNQLINCGKVRGDSCQHNYQAGANLAPTCESIGYESQVCTQCGDTRYAFKPATGHDWEVIAYWEEAGVDIYGCKVCKGTKYEPHGTNDDDNNDNNGGDSGDDGGDHGGSSENSKTQLYVYAQDMGYGSKWLQGIKAGFEEYYQDVEFEAGKKGVQVVLQLNKQQLQANVVQSLNADLYVVYNGSVNYDELYASGCLEEITDAATTPWGNESKTVLDKLPLEQVYMQQGRAYAMPYANMQYGITYNATLFDEKELEVPNTTDELLELCNEMCAYGITPFTSSGMYFEFFWGDLTDIWWAQYEGAEAYARYWEGENENGQFTVENFSQEGRLKSLQVFEALSVSRNHDSRSMNSSTSNLLAIENLLLGGYSSSRNEIAMMPYVDCLYTEAAYIFQELQDMYISVPTIRMMKTPVISSIIEKCPTIANDETLSAVIDAIDNGMTSYTGVSNEDFNRVAAARGMVANKDGVSAFVKRGTTKATLAKEFLRYLTSDQAIAIAAANGMKTVFNYEYTVDQMQKFDPITQDAYAMQTAEKSVYLPMKNHTILYKAGLYSWYPFNALQGIFRGQATATAVFEDTKAYYQNTFQHIYQSAKGA